MDTLITTRPDDFVNVADVIPTIETDVKYFSGDNFIGSRIDGYSAPIIYLTRACVGSLERAQDKLSEKGLGLRLYDGYRPFRAVEAMLYTKRVTTESADYFPGNNVDLQELLYSCACHNRGSAVDLTIIDRYTGIPLDMGSPYDLLDLRARMDYADLKPEQSRNRMLLKYLMLSCGFEAVPSHWWCFMLKNEPYPQMGFDFEIV